jgi:hypothetical protein
MIKTPKHCSVRWINGILCEGRKTLIRGRFSRGVDNMKWGFVSLGILLLLGLNTFPPAPASGGASENTANATFVVQ